MCNVARLPMNLQAHVSKRQCPAEVVPTAAPPTCLVVPLLAPTTEKPKAFFVDPFTLRNDYARHAHGDVADHEDSVPGLSLCLGVKGLRFSAHRLGCKRI